MSANDLEQQNCYKNQLSLKVLFSQGQKTIQEPIFFYVHASSVYIYIINFNLVITNMTLL